MKDRPDVSAAQCRAARALLGWTQAGLAERAGITRKTIGEFEAEIRKLQLRTRHDIAAALMEAGIALLDGDGVCRAATVEVARSVDMVQA